MQTLKLGSESTSLFGRGSQGELGVTWKSSMGNERKQVKGAPLSKWSAGAHPQWETLEDSLEPVFELSRVGTDKAAVFMHQ